MSNQTKEVVFFNAKLFEGCNDLTVADIEDCRRAGKGKCTRLSQCDRIKLETWGRLLNERDKGEGNLERLVQLAFGQGHLFVLFLAQRPDRLWASLTKQPPEFAKDMITVALKRIMGPQQFNSEATRATRAPPGEVPKNCTERLKQLNMVLWGTDDGLSIALKIFNAAGLSFWYEQLSDCIVEEHEASAKWWGNDCIPGVIPLLNDFVAEAMDEKRKPNLVEALHNGLEKMMPAFSNVYIPGFTAEQLRTVWKQDTVRGMDLEALAEIKRNGNNSRMCGANDIVPDFSYMNDPTPREDKFCPPGTRRRRYNGEFAGCCKKSIAKWHDIKTSIWDNAMTGAEAKQRLKQVQSLCKQRHQELQTELKKTLPATTLDEQAKRKQIEDQISNIKSTYPTDSAIDDEAARFDRQIAQLRKDDEARMKQHENRIREMFREEKSNAAGSSTNASGVGDLYEDMMKTAYKMAMTKVEDKLLDLVRYEGDTGDDKDEDAGRLAAAMSYARGTVLSAASFTAKLLIQSTMVVLKNPQLINVVLTQVKSYRDQLCRSISVKLGYERKVNAWSMDGIKSVGSDVNKTFTWGYEMFQAVSGPGLADSLKSGAEMVFEVAEVGSNIAPIVGPAGVKLAKAAGGYMLTNVHQGIKIYAVTEMYKQGLGKAMELFTAPCIQNHEKLCGTGFGPCDPLLKGSTTSAS